MNNKTYFFMAGLPRSGSSLLSAILNQNDSIFCGPSSPIVSTMLNIEKSLVNDELYLASPKPSFMYNLMSQVVDCYYDDVEKPIVVDKNRSWPRYIDWMKQYLGIENPKIVVTVRDIADTLASFITLIRQNEGNNFVDKRLASFNAPVNDFTRCQWLASDGPIGRSFTSIQIAFDNNYKQHLHFVEYNDLINDPHSAMQSIYQFLEQPLYEHDFANIVNCYPEKDEDIYGLPGMHKVRSQIKNVAPKATDVLPSNVIEDVTGLEFWRQ